jgi:hypothetical protein
MDLNLIQNSGTLIMLFGGKHQPTSPEIRIHALEHDL